jgi:hypothetical protein
MEEIAQILKTAAHFGRYSDEQTFKESLEETIKEYKKQIFESKEFEEAACEHCREMG